jgi:hypothetical protein
VKLTIKRACRRDRDRVMPLVIIDILNDIQVDYDFREKFI